MIHKSAYLQMCICGEHGHFVLSDGTTGTEFCSKGSAREELNRLRSLRKIELDEFRFLGDQVHDCKGLAHDDDEADSVSLYKCQLINEKTEESDQEDNEDESIDFKKGSSKPSVH